MATGEFTIPDVRTGRRVLVVDPDYDTLAALAGALRSRGLEVVLAADGRTGLDRAVSSAPDLILVDVDVPLVDIRTFLEILRGNPRTSSIPVFLMGKGDVRRLPLPEALEGAFGKPFQVDEVATRIETLLSARAVARDSVAPDLQVRGDLAQVPLADILQVFSMNRRTGTFLLSLKASASEIAMRDGEIIEARFGPAGGFKAIVRMLAETGGQFQFVPDRAPAKGSLSGSTEALIVEALRQNDELARLSPELPPRQALLYAPRRGLPPAPDDAGREILALCAEPRSLDSVFDQSSWLDVETALVVASLLRSGRLTVRSEGIPRVPLADQDGMSHLRGCVQHARRAGMPGPPRLLVPVADAAAASRLAGSLGWIEEFAPEGTSFDAAAPIGALGTLRLGEAIDLELTVIPADPRLRPAWMPMCAASVAALVIAPADDEIAAREAERFLRDDAEVPVCIVAWLGSWPGAAGEGDLHAESFETPEGTAEILRAVIGRMG